jgi:hypothetical protein
MRIPKENQVPQIPVIASPAPGKVLPLAARKTIVAENLFLYFSLFLISCSITVVSKARFWDLGTEHGLVWTDWLSASSCVAMLIVMDLFGKSGLGWFVVALVVALVCVLFFEARKPAPAPPPASPPIADCGSASELARFIEDSKSPVIPRAFAEGASEAEIHALVTRQKLDPRNRYLILGLTLPLGLVPTIWLKVNHSLEIVIFATFIVAQVCFFRWAMRRQDRRLDLDALKITKDPTAYIQAIERAARTLAWTPTLPFWFRRDSIETRTRLILKHVTTPS